MPHREIDIIIHANGEVELSVHGYKGRKCLEAVQFFEEMVGPVRSARHTSEFYEPEEEVRYRQDLPMSQRNAASESG